MHVGRQHGRFHLCRVEESRIARDGELDAGDGAARSGFVIVAVGACADDDVVARAKVQSFGNEVDLQ